MLLAIEIAAFLFFAAGTHELIVPLAKPTTTDFVSFYAAGTLADTGSPQLAYNKAEHYAAEQRATRPGIDYNFCSRLPSSLSQFEEAVGHWWGGGCSDGEPLVDGF